MKWLLLAGCLAAAILDIHTGKITNQLLTVIFTACFSFRLLFQPVSGDFWLTGAFQACAVGIIFLFPWKLRMIGAGDVKLLMLLGGFLDTESFAACGLWAAFLSGALAAVRLMRQGNAAERFRYFGSWAAECFAEGKVCPYMKRKDFSMKNTIPLSVGICMGYVCMMIFG